MTSLTLPRPLAARWQPDKAARLAAFGGAWGFAVLAVAYALVNHPTFMPPDAIAYWASWANGLYAPSAQLWQGGYIYSPAFAQAIWPLTRLPWPAFLALWTAAAFAAYAWLLAPVRLVYRIPLLVTTIVALTAGNIEWMFAVLIALRLPAGWGPLALLTKVSPAAALAWHLGARDGRGLALAIGLSAGLIVISLAIAPQLWIEWLGVLDRSRAADLTGAVYGLDRLPIPNVAVRAVLAGLLALWGGRSARPWTIAVAMVVAQPDLYPNTFFMLAAIPRLHHPG